MKIFQLKYSTEIGLLPLCCLSIGIVTNIFATIHSSNLLCVYFLDFVGGILAVICQSPLSLIRNFYVRVQCRFLVTCIELYVIDCI